MITQKLIELLDGYGSFDKITTKLSNRKDLHAFILLSKLVQSDEDIVVSAEHDQIWFGVSVEDLAKSTITEEQALELCCCGVWYDRSSDGLSMFV